MQESAVGHESQGKDISLVASRPEQELKRPLLCPLHPSEKPARISEVTPHLGRTEHRPAHPVDRRHPDKGVASA